MRRAIIPAVILSLLAAGCGSSSGGDANSSSASGPIILYQILPTESQVTSLPFMVTAAQAAVDEINAAGGVDGRKLKLETCNDKYDPNEALRCAQQAVRAKPAAVVGSLTGFGAQVLPVLEHANIPMVGADAVSTADATSKMSFLLDTGTLAYAGLPSVAKQFLGLSKVSPMDQDTASAADDLAYYKLGAKASDVSLTDQILLPADAVDFSTYLQRVRSSGGQAIITAMADAPLLKIFQAKKAAGINIPVLASLSSLRPDVIAQAGAVANGSWALSGIPNGDSSDQWGRQYVAAMAKYEPKEKVLGALGFRAWASVHFFAQVAGTVRGDVTNDSVLDALNKVHDMKFMWINSLSFDKPGPIKEYPRLVATTLYPFEVKGGQLVARKPFDPFQG